MVTLEGVTKQAKVWAEERELSWAAVWTRRNRGETWADALNPEPREDAVQRARKNTCICAASTLVTLDGETKEAPEWAAERGLKWQTVKMRRMRGAGWAEALCPQLRGRRWMDSFTMANG